MFATALIVFRECLEICLIAGVILAATRGVSGRKRMATLGITCGIAGSIVLAFFADQISTAAAGFGQEIVNAAILGGAAFLIGWTVIWMQKHGRKLSHKASQIGKDIVQGDRHIISIAFILGLSTLREGAEIVLFMSGVLLSETISIADIIMGGLIGLLSGLLCGFSLYWGLIRISPKHLFQTTGWLLTFLAAGLATQAASFLIAADILPTLVDQIWDLSNILPETGLPGQILHITIGYKAQPNGLELAIYVMTLLVIVGLWQWQKKAIYKTSSHP